MNAPHPVIAIIGGGPAGMGCALWLNNMGFAPIIIEKGADLGGQANSIKRINRWFLGQQDRSSADIVSSFSDHINHESIRLKLQHSLVKINRQKPGVLELTLESANGQQESLVANAMVIASGQRANNETVFSKLSGYNLIHQNEQFCSFPLDHLDLQDQIKAKRVAVLGGGDNAYCTALDLGENADNVSLIMRSIPRAQKHFQLEAEAFKKQGKLKEYRDSKITGFTKQGNALEIFLEQSQGKHTSIIVDWVFARLGFSPTTAFLNSLQGVNDLQLDPAGYIVIDSKARTSIPNIYAIGDVTGYQPSSIINAAAHGAIAAQAIEIDLRTIN